MSVAIGRKLFARKKSNFPTDRSATDFDGTTIAATHSMSPELSDFTDSFRYIREQIDSFTNATSRYPLRYTNREE